jgi:OmcA/MtrC family decaheme c-type cytochrome
MKMHFKFGILSRLALVAFVLLGALALFSETKPPFTERDKAFYADEAKVNFVRPGLVFKIEKVTIAADGTVVARFLLTDPKGLPLDRDGITTPGNVSTSFILATIPKGSNVYNAYTTRTKTSTYPATVGKKAKQASSDTGGKYAKVADGEYDYTFGYKLPASYDQTATHAVGMYGSRNLTEFDLGTNYASTEYYFVPNGAAVTELRDIIDTESCNKCHGDLNFHGGSRKGLELCIMCHTPAYADVTNLNPETDNTIDMKVMAHKIHMGASLPSVQAGGSYQIVGFGNAVSDFSDVNIPSKPNNCAWCHDGKAPQGDKWNTNPNMAACGACHDNINFATGEGHLGLPQFNDNQCKNCHIPQGEIDFDASIKGAHVIEQESSLAKGVVVKITSVSNTNAGQNPVVNFTLTDRSGAPLDPAKINRVAVTMAGPTTDYVGVGKVGYITDTATKSVATSNGWQWTMSTPVPADAKGTYAIAMEARVMETVLAGTLKERTFEIGATNPVVYFSVDGSPVAKRRQVVSNDTCNQCHYNLSLHGENRNQTEYCVMCHNPVQNDAGRRTPDVMPAESIDFNLMVHRIHSGDQQIRDYTIYGFGGSKNNYNDITFPQPLSNCSACHLKNTNNVPADATAMIADVRGLINPVASTTGACTSCHTSTDAASHALANTTTLGESCAVCHGPNAQYAVSKVHAQ